MKCHECGKVTEDLQEFSKEKYCQECYSEKKAVEIDRQILRKYICHIFDIDNPTPMMYGQMKNFYNDGISYKNQALTLKYIIEVENTTLDKKYGIGLVKLKHAEMIDYYKKQLEKQESVEVVDYETVDVNVKQTTNENKNVFEGKKLIDLDNIF